MTRDVPFRRPDRLFPCDGIEQFGAGTEENVMENGLVHELYRVPGLFRRFELALVLESGTDYRIEDAGETADGYPLVAVYRYPCPAPDHGSETTP